MSRSQLAWSSVDANPEPERYISFLDGMNALSAVRRYKEKTFALLELGAGQSVLDVGCGTGEDVLSLAKLVAPARVVGLDISRTMIEEARARNQSFLTNVSFQIGDACHLQFADAEFDRCRIDRVLQHIAKPDLALAQIKRVLKLGGVLVTSEPDWRTLLIDSSDQRLTEKVVGTICSSVPNCEMGRALPRLLAAAGFKETNLIADTLIIRSFALADNVFGLVSACQQALTAGILSESEGLAFLADLERRDKAGYFFAAITGFAAQAFKR